MLPDLRRIYDVFFDAMGNGYARNDIEPTSIVELPGSKLIPFVSGEYKVTDCYFVSPRSDKSGGFTTIYHEDDPVWMMHYGGRYAKIAIPFLKQCLHRAYVGERRFYGGRGPHFVRDERFTYINMVRRESFTDFEGEEKIFDADGHEVGHHRYGGMSLLKHH